MADAGTAVFRAIADFGQLRREAQGAAGDLNTLKTSADQVGTTKGPQQAGQSLTDLANKSEKTGRSLTRNVTLPVVALGVVAVKTFTEFDTAIQRTAANTGATTEEFKKLHDMALEMGAATQFSATDAANAMFELSAAGVSTRDIMDGAIQSVLLLAGATGTDLAQSAQVVAQAMNAFGISAEDTAHVADVLTQAANQSAIDMTGLAEALSHAGQLGSTANQDLESVVSVLQSMVNQGVPAAQAGTAVAQAMQNLKAPTDKAAAALAKYGIEVRNADGTMKQLPDIIQAVEDGLGGLGQAERDAALDAIFGVEAMKAMGLAMNTVVKKSPEVAADMEDLKKIASVMGQEFVDSARQIDGSYQFAGAAGVKALDALNKASDGTAKAFDEKLGKTLSRQLESLKGSFETLAIVVVETILPAVKSLMPKLIGFVNVIGKIAKAAPWLTQLVLGFLLLLATLGPVLIMFAKVIKAIQAVSGAMKALGALAKANPWVLLLMALVVVAILIYKNWDKVKAVLGKAWKIIKNVGKAVAEAFGDVIDWFKKLPGVLGRFLTKLWDTLTAPFRAAWNAVYKIVAAALSILKTLISTGFGAFVTVVRTAVSAFVGVVKAGWDWLVKVVTTAVNIVRSVIEAAWNLISTIVSTIMNGITAGISAAWSVITTVIGVAVGVIKGIIAGFKAVLDGIVTVFNTISSIVGGVWDTVKNAIGGAIDWIVDKIKTLLDWIGKVTGPLKKIWDWGSGAWDKVTGFLGFATGGEVPGSGTGDTVPAMLTPGEFVIRKAAVRSIGVGVLAAMNRTGGVPGTSSRTSASSLMRRAERGRVQHFATGGLVNPTTGAAVGGGAVNQTNNIDITIVNPVGETTEASLHRSMQKLAIHGVLPSSLTGAAA
jgi:TP901 family phage tail tape measure protein